MRLIKLAVISFAVLFLLMTGISLMMPSTILVSRSIRINAPKDTVMHWLVDLNQWNQWSANLDSSKQYPVTQSATGSALSADKTTIAITAADSNSVRVTWQSSATLLTGSFNILTNSSNAAGTSLQWEIVHHVPWYPWEKFAGIFSDKAIGRFMEQSLDKLKWKLEHQAD